MNIETVKWQWAKGVKSPNVYRDYELIRSKTKEEALEAIDFLLLKPARGRTYTITVLQNEEYLTYYFHSMPCMGGLAKYKDHHGDKYFMNPYLPRDIRVAFPEGTPVFIGIPSLKVKAYLEDPYYQFVLSEESPWIAGFGSKDSIIFKDTYFVLTNMDTDPTVFYSLLRMGHLVDGHCAWTKYSNPKAEILYSLMHAADPRRLAGQKPHKISGGTWAEGYGYTRPYNEAIFHHSLPLTLKEFVKLPSNTGTYSPRFVGDYFIKTMKDKFNVDIMAYKPNMDGALVEAWDYFKEQAKELDNV